MTTLSPRSICVSYARPDGQRAADALRFYCSGHGLLREDLARWEDLADDGSNNGWRQRVGAAVTTADNLVMIVSPNWLETEVAHFAVDSARQKGVRVMPVLVDRRIEASSLPDWLKVDPICRLDLDGSSANVEADLQRFLASLVNATFEPQPTAPETARRQGVQKDFSSEWLLATAGVPRSPYAPLHERYGGTALVYMRRLIELKGEQSTERRSLEEKLKILMPGAPNIIADVYDGAYDNSILSLSVFKRSGKGEDHWSKIVETSNKKAASSRANDLAAKWRAVEDVLTDVASLSPPVKALFAATDEFRKVQAAFAAAVASITNTSIPSTASTEASPLTLPDTAPVLYQGKKRDGDALAFVRRHYAPWLEERLLDLPALEKLDKKLWNAVRNESYLGGRADEVKALFPSTVEVRDARGEVRPVGELRKIWRQQQSRHRARRREP